MTTFQFSSQIALTSTNPNIRSIANKHAQSLLRLRPAFQRNLVWNDEQKSYLIDSILRNCPIPELYIQIGDTPNGNEDLIIVVDGQQRLSTCISFLLGELRLVGEDLDPEWKGCTFEQLSHERQTQFKKYKFLFRELPDLEDEHIREIFRRLNRVVEPLLPQELRHAAYSGPYLELIESAALHPVLQEIRVFSARDIRRRSSDELLAEIIYASAKKEGFPNKKEGLDETFRRYERQGLPPGKLQDLRRRLGRVFEQLKASADTIRRTRFKNKSDFYTLLVLLLRRAESLPLPEDGATLLHEQLCSLSERISEIREAMKESNEVASSSEGEDHALVYMRAVERAASDRLNRLRRHEALEACLGEALAMGQVTPLVSSDESWLDELEDIDEKAAAELEAERENLRRVLTEED